MMPENRISQIIRAGLYTSLLLMLAGVVVTFSGHYSESLRLSFENVANGRLLTDGAGLMYLGTLFLIATPVAVLIYLTVYYLISSTKRYALYCIMMLLVLFLTVLMKV